MPVALITPPSLFQKPGMHVDMLREAGFSIEYPTNPDVIWGRTSERETIEQLSNCDAVIATGEHFTAAVLAALPRLRVIARCGVGYDRVDVAAATARGIPVTITPTANFDAVAEQTFALIFAVAKSVVRFDRRMRDGQWYREITRPLRTSTLGIFGLGRIGRAVAVRGRALGMQIIATEAFPDETFAREHDIELVELDELLSRSDYLSVHCPLNDQTQGMFNADLFARMKPDSVFINTARGHLVDEAALVAALESGRLRGAGLDVFEHEPPGADNPLLKLDKVILSPHVAGQDTLSAQNMGNEAADCIVKLYRGQWPTGAVVNDQLRDGWKW